MSNIKSIGQGVRGLRLPKIRGFPLTLNVALTAVLRTNVLHCDTSLIRGTDTGHRWLEVFEHFRSKHIEDDVTFLKGQQTLDPNTFRAQYLDNSYRRYLATTANY